MVPRAALGTPPRQRPVQFLRIALAQRFTERSGCRHRAGDHQDARGVAIEAMDQPRPLFLLKFQVLEQQVDMTADAAAALCGQAGRLVEDQHGRIAMQDKAFGKYPLLFTRLWIGCW